MSRKPAAVLAVIVVVVVFAHVVTFGDAFSRFREVLDVAHVIGFALLTYWLLSAAERRSLSAEDSPGRSRVAVVAFVALLALAAEGAQLFVARNASLGDLIRDAGGVAGGVAGFAAVRARGASRAAPAIFSVACLVAVLWLPGRALVSIAVARTQLPQLLGFDTHLETPRYEILNATAVRTPMGDGWPVAGLALDISVDPAARYSGVSFTRLPRDWSGYSAVSFVAAARANVTNGDSTWLEVRIHDVGHTGAFDDRFNRRWRIGREPMRFRISLDDIRSGPRDRLLDTSRIEDMTVFVTVAESGGFRIDDLRFE